MSAAVLCVKRCSPEVFLILLSARLLLYGISAGENERIPSEEEIEKAKVLIDYRHIEIGERSVFSERERNVSRPGRYRKRVCPS